MEIKSIIDKPLIFIEEGKTSKVESKIVVDKNFKKIYYLKTLIDGFPYYLSIKKIYSIGLDAIVVKSTKLLKSENEFELLPNMFVIDFDSRIYTYLGDYVTKIDNIKIDKDFLITELLLEKEISLTKIISSGEKIIIIDDLVKKMRKPTAKKFPENKKSNDKIEVKILPRKTSKITFLQGRIATKDILSLSGEILIKRGSLITEKHIEEAKKNYKIQELILYSKEY